MPPWLRGPWPGLAFASRCYGARRLLEVDEALVRREAGQSGFRPVG